METATLSTHARHGIVLLAACIALASCTRAATRQEPEPIAITPSTHEKAERGAPSARAPAPTPSAALDAGATSDPRKGELTLRGEVQAAAPPPSADGGKPIRRGKVFHGVFLVERGGPRWVLDYAADSPYRVFDGKSVVARGTKFVPQYQALIDPHLEVREIAIEKPQVGDSIIRMGAAQTLEGAFGRHAFPKGSKLEGESMHVFRANGGRWYFIAHQPASPKVPDGKRITIDAREVEPSPFETRPGGPYLWIERIAIR